MSGRVPEASTLHQRRRRPRPRGLGAAAVAAALLVLGLASPSDAYIGPGAGFAVLGSFLVVIAAVALGGLVLVTWPLRAILRSHRRRRAFARAQVDRVIVLGLDGMDPDIVERMIAAGRLPNLAALADRGSYARLSTTCPAMSPVAWSSFMTGATPGRHGIFDFLHRDPKTYLPDLSSARIRPPRRVLSLGRLAVPLGRPSIRLLRRSRPFWSVLSDHGVFSTVIRVPITFPPERFGGLLLSGMCVPDLRGTQGSYTFFTSASDAETEDIGGRRLPLTRENGCYRGALPGPPLTASSEPAQIEFRLYPHGNSQARLHIAGTRVPLTQGRHSDWVPLSFRVAPGLRANGICRFYLRSAVPPVELYASPINIDPERPALPVSHPLVYSVYLSKRLGRFATLGLAEDTWALNEGILDDAAFREQCDLMFHERRRMLLNALDNARRGCVVCVFDTTDRIQHMFWRYADPGHPAPRECDQDHGRAIDAAYEQADALVGEVMARLRERDALLVMSDHGFQSFRRGVNLNSWLLREGYLALKPGATGDSQWLRDVDWSHTRAYAIGLGGLYLNVRGREAQGIVPHEQVAALKAELIGKLTGLADGDGSVAIERVFDTAAVNAGPYSSEGPDLTIGYGVGYRASWDAAQGKVSGPVIEDNTRRWSGDHCCDPKHVPGILFSSRPLAARQPRIIDIAPTILFWFGVETPAYMQGRSLLPDERKEGAGDG